MKYLISFIIFLVFVPVPVLVFDFSNIGNSAIANKSRDKLEDLNAFFRQSLTYLKKRSLNAGDVPGNHANDQARNPRPVMTSFMRGQPISRHYYNIYIRDSPSLNFHHYLHSLGIPYPNSNFSAVGREGNTVNGTTYWHGNFRDNFTQSDNRNENVDSSIGWRSLPGKVLTTTTERKIIPQSSSTIKSSRKPSSVGVSTTNSVLPTPAEDLKITTEGENRTKGLDEELNRMVKTLKEDIAGGKALNGNLSIVTKQKENNTDILIQIINLSPVIVTNSYHNASSTQNTSTDATKCNNGKTVVGNEEEPENVKIEEFTINRLMNRTPVPVRKSSSAQFISFDSETPKETKPGPSSVNPVTLTSKLTPNFGETEKFLMEPSTLVEQTPASIEYRVLKPTGSPSKKQRQLYSFNDLVKLKKEYPAYGKHSKAEVLRSLKILDLKSALEKKAKHSEQYGDHAEIIQEIRY